MSQPPIPLETLYGTWKLIAEERTVIEGDKRFVVATGEIGAGYITYGRDGRMTAMIVRASRPTPESIATISDQQRIGLFSTMVAYGGTFEFDGHSVTHHIDISWNQIWTGTSQTRDVTRDGDRLVYRSRPAPNAYDGRTSSVMLVWERLAPPA
jgi:hypothetical protein